MKNIRVDFLDTIDKDAVETIKGLVLEIADESENFPFTSDDINISNEYFENFLNFLIKSPNSTICLGYFENKLVGLAFLEGGKKMRTFHLANLGIGVLQLYRNQGIGSMLLDSLVNYSLNSEYIAKIDVIVREDNKIAIELYKKKNFKFEGRNLRSFYINEKFYNTVSMGILID